MDKHNLGLRLPVMERPWAFPAIGAGCSGFLLIIIWLVPRIINGGAWALQDVGYYLVLPAVVAVIAGSAIGWAVGITRAKGEMSLTKRILAWGLLGGAVAVLAPAGLIFVWTWAWGEAFDFAGVKHHPPPPMSLSAMGDALGYALEFALLLGLPLFAFGSIVGVAVALVKRAHKNQTLRPSPAVPNAADVTVNVKPRLPRANASQSAASIPMSQEMTQGRHSA